MSNITSTSTPTTTTTTSSTTTTTTSTSNNNISPILTGLGGVSISPPNLQIAIRSKTTSFFETSPKYFKNESFPCNSNSENANKHIEYSKDGSMIAFINMNNIVVYKSATGEIHATIERPAVSCISFSPQNTYLLTYERLTKEINNENNLIVWDLSTQKEVFKSTQKYFEQDSWPLIKWTDDETLAGRLMKNEIHFFNGRSIGVLAKKIKLPEVTGFYFAPGEPYRICTFVPEQKAIPGSAKIYQYPNTSEHIAHLSFFKCNEAKVMWNKKGDAVLIHTFTLIDKSGKSYYGETGLWYLSLDGSSFNVSVDGPIHDVQWSPTFEQFVVVHGNMPSQTTLYNNKGNPLVDFGNLPRNTVRFSPNGKLLAIGGFGNLHGDIDFWDLTRYKKIASTTAYCASYHEWAADSIHFAAAVLSPRIRVDNGFKVIKYDGTVVFKESIPELYQVQWRPQSPYIFPDEKIVFKSEIQQTTKYVPPSQRNNSSSSTTTSPSTTSSNNSSPSTTTPPPPGFKIYLTQSQSNAKKQAQTQQSPKTTTTTTKSNNYNNNNHNANNKEKDNNNNNNNNNEPKEKKELTPLDKKIRSLERKLKEVETLKLKMSQDEFLPPTAIEKISNEGKFREELNQLINERNQTLNN